MLRKIDMLIIGLTGGIGSGKSVVAGYFQKLGAYIIDADDIARELVKPSQYALNEIVKHFGNDILDNKQQLDRTKLREKIFANPAEKLWLENLLHPLIREQIQNKLTNAEGAYCILVIPLLFETNYRDFIQRILVVDTTEQLQLERTTKRDHCSIEQVTTIIKSQINREQRRTGADDIIMNDGDLNKLFDQIKQLHKFYLKLARQIKREPDN